MFILKIHDVANPDEAVYEQYDDPDLLRAEFQEIERSEGKVAEIYVRDHASEFSNRIPEEMTRKEASELYDCTV